MSKRVVFEPSFTIQRLIHLFSLTFRLFEGLIEVYTNEITIETYEFTLKGEPSFWKEILKIVNNHSHSEGVNKECLIKFTLRFTFQVHLPILRVILFLDDPSSKKRVHPSKAEWKFDTNSLVQKFQKISG